MKILLTMNIPYVFAHGGANKANRFLAEEFALRGHDVEVVIPAVGVPARLTLTEFMDRLVRQGVSVRERPRGLEFRLAGVSVHAATDGAQLRSLLMDRLAAFSPDWILVSTEDPSQNLLATALAFDSPRVVYLVHSPTFLPFGPQAFFASPTRTRLVGQVAAIVTCSRFVAEYVRRWSGLEAQPLYWPAYGRGPFPDLSRFDGGYVTMINPCEVKGLSIFRQLVDALPDVSFAAVPTWGTTSDDRAGLAGRPNLRFLEPSDDIDTVLGQSRILLMPSIWPEGFPLTCVEAMARGIPVLASQVQGLTEAKLGTDFVLPVRPIERFEERVDENLVPVPAIPEQEAGTWREGLLNILSSRDLYEQQSRAQRQAALAFIGSVSAAPFEDLLRKLAASPRRKVVSRAPAVAEPMAIPAAEDLHAGLEKLSPSQQALLTLWLRKKAVERAGDDDLVPPLRPVPRNRPLPLSFAQQRLWFLDQLEPGSPLYNMPSALRLSGGVSIGELRRTLDTIVQRHEALRTTFAIRNGEPVQVIAPQARVVLPSVDLRALPCEQRRSEVRRLAEEEAMRPFDLERGPLLRNVLLWEEERQYVLLLTMHHIISDGWTFGILSQEVVALYEAYSAGQASPLADLSIQYADFAVWQREWLRGEKLESEIAYWRERLAGLPGSFHFPTDRPHPLQLSFRSGSWSLDLQPSLSNGLQEISRREGASLFMVLLTAWKVLLVRHAGQEDITVGTAIANRNRPELEGLVGLFVNTLVLRTSLTGEPSFRQALARVRDVCLGAYAHQDLPFEKLVEVLQPQRNHSHSPFFQVLFVLQNMPTFAFELPGLQVRPIEQNGESAKFDLNLTAAEDKERISLTLRYRRDLFDEPTVERLLARLETLLAAALRDPGERISGLELLPEAERHQIMREWNDGVRFFPGEETVIDRFERQATLHPERTALVEGEQRLSFSDLRDRAWRLASRLRRRGVGPEVRVGLFLEPSFAMVVGVLGILRAGGAYVGLDTGSPPQRLAAVLEGAGLHLLLTRRAHLSSLPAQRSATVLLDEDWPEIAAEEPLTEPGEDSQDQLAYVIYTSGSTGLPKAVGNSHRQLLSYLDAIGDMMGVAEEESFNLHQTLAVDASITHLFLPLILGGSLHLLGMTEIGDPEVLQASLEKNPLDYIKIAPSHLDALLRSASSPERLLPRRQLMLGGEAMSLDLARRLRGLSNCSLLNHYGPTETTVGSIAGRIPEEKDRFFSTTVPIGRPLANTRAYILDGNGRLSAIGVGGELFLGGGGVSRGYLGQPELTAVSFVPDPFAETPGQRLYRTGDRARYLPDGRIEFLGRIDHQVKVRGYRVEMGEIEAVLVAQPGVGSAAVSFVDGVDRSGRLVAYVVPARAESLSLTQLRSGLRRTLPEYMVPSAFLVLEALPRTAHGKVDRRALPPPRELQPAREYVAPRSPVEETLARIWSEVLGVQNVGIHDSFFELGGHSLLATQLVARMRRALGTELPLRLLFEAPTIAEIIQALSVAGQREPHRPTLTSAPRAAHRIRRSVVEEG